MTRLQQDRLAALKASTELQARIKAENTLRDALQALHIRLMQCSKYPILVSDAYDSFYQDATLEALGCFTRSKQ